VKFLLTISVKILYTNFMSFFTKQRCILLLVAVMVIIAPGVSYAQLDLKAKAVETLTNGVMKELEKKFTETVAKEAISAAAKTNVVNKLSEMSRPIVKSFIDSATSGKLPNQAELVNKVMKDILPRVPELVAASATDGVAGSVAQTAGQVQASVSAQLQYNYDDEKDFTVEIIGGGSSVRITRYTGRNTELRIPPRIGEHPVTEIGERVFIKKGLTSVVIPESVIFIGNMAFADNKIGSVSLGANVYIADNAFENTAYNSFSAEFYNSQGRKAGTYNNNWKLASAAAPQPTARPGSTASAGTTGTAASASAVSANTALGDVVFISSTSGWEANKNDKSSASVSINKEQIDSRELEVLTIDVNLKKDGNGWGWAGAMLNNRNIIQGLHNADGIRFKVLGDGQKWRVQIVTSNVTDSNWFGTIIQTQKGKVISIDIPFSNLKQPGGKKTTFVKRNINGMKFEKTVDKGTGPSVIKIFDFEIY
jgi:hypothetical protein